MTTREKILLESLRLFSSKGYDSVSVEEIAKAVGIKAPSLYKHYKSKQSIFDAIFEETARKFDDFVNTIMIHDTNNQTISKLDRETLTNKAIDYFKYSIHDEFNGKFRKMMTIEQFRTKELATLYSQRYMDMMVGYHEQIFQKLMNKGVLIKTDPHSLAMMYDAPIILMIFECDRHPEKEEECIKRIVSHVKLFYDTFSIKK